MAASKNCRRELTFGGQSCVIHKFDRQSCVLHKFDRQSCLIHNFDGQTCVINEKFRVRKQSDSPETI